MWTRAGLHYTILKSVGLVVVLLAAIALLLLPSFLLQAEADSGAENSQWAQRVAVNLVTCAVLEFCAVWLLLKRLTRSYPGLTYHVVIVLVFTSILGLATTMAISGTGMDFQPSFLIPVTTWMVTQVAGNILRALEIFFTAFQAAAGRMELMLAMGASRSEAWRVLYNKCAVTALAEAVGDLTLVDRGNVVTVVPMLLVGMLFAGGDLEP